MMFLESRGPNTLVRQLNHLSSTISAKLLTFIFCMFSNFKLFLLIMYMV